MVSRRASDIWQVVLEERRALIQDLEALPLQQWRTPSLCPGWDIHDVLAHLVDTAKMTHIGFVRSMVSARFDFDRANAAGVARERAEGPRRTLTEFRAVASRTTTPPAPVATRLVEAFVHGEDIRRPLGIRRDYPVSHVIEALNHQLKTTVKIGGGRERAEGFHLVADDAAFEHGAGEEVRGSAITILLAVSGRRNSGSELTGAGAHAFAHHSGLP